MSLFSDPVDEPWQVWRVEKAWNHWLPTMSAANDSRPDYLPTMSAGNPAVKRQLPFGPSRQTPHLGDRWGELTITTMASEVPIESSLPWKVQIIVLQALLSLDGSFDTKCIQYAKYTYCTVYVPWTIGVVVRMSILDTKVVGSNLSINMFSPW